jgi:hypothetical protein
VIASARRAGSVVLLARKQVDEVLFVDERSKDATLFKPESLYS